MSLPGCKDRALKIYDGLYHEILNEPERAAVVDDLLAWIAERTHPARTQEPALRGCVIQQRRPVRSGPRRPRTSP
jgi:hypothetical protein